MLSLEARRKSSRMRSVFDDAQVTWHSVRTKMVQCNVTEEEDRSAYLKSDSETEQYNTESGPSTICG